MRLVLLALVVSSCLPQVGPAIDAGASSAGGAATAGGVATAGGGTAGATAAGGSAGGGSAAATCTDNQQNGTETDVDCGGSCAPCAINARCVSALDCTSGLCASSRCTPAGNSCRSFGACSSYVDLTASPTHTIRFPVGGDRYSPDCIRVRFGQTVTFQGDFGSHPMEQPCGPVAMPGLTMSTGNSSTVTMNTALGVFGFFCNRHGSSTGSGMAGAIEVVR